jgi:hypothetical protein
VPVKIYPSRADIVPYLGVRHIAGVRPWDALAKAKYIKLLVDNKISIGEIKKMVGIQRGDVIQRWLLTLYALNQVNSIGEERWEEAYGYFSFSFLYTALGYRSVREYLGIDSELLNNPRENPVAKKSEKKLIDLMDDLYGRPSDPARRKVGESRNIRQLAAIYDSREALSVLRSGGTLGEAYGKTVGEAQELLDLLYRSSYCLDKAMGIAPHHKKNPEARKYAKRCLDSAKVLYDDILED